MKRSDSEVQILQLYVQGVSPRSIFKRRAKLYASKTSLRGLRSCAWLSSWWRFTVASLIVYFIRSTWPFVGKTIHWIVF